MNKQYIIITGRRNTGKSSLINKILGQQKAIVSDTPGTTTDPVKKSFEIPGIASAILIDTAGTDDDGQLGRQRIEKTFDTIRQANTAILVINENRFGNYEEELINEFHKNEIPFFILHNQSDRTPLTPTLKEQLETLYKVPVIEFSTQNNDTAPLIGILQKIILEPENKSLLSGLVNPGDIIMLVTPIDSGAPTGRMILPQVQTIRDVLDNRCVNIVLQPEEISHFLAHTGIPPTLVITDSQAFGKVSRLIPQSIPLTSFSIVLAHHKGNFPKLLEGTRQIANLNDGDRILILESCSHHTSCEDIGRVKIPALLRKCTGKQLEFDFIAGLDNITRPVANYALVIQCGGCMITAQQLRNRLRPAIENGIPVSNYGMTIAYTLGIFERAVEPFGKGI